MTSCTWLCISSTLIVDKLFFANCNSSSLKCLFASSNGGYFVFCECLDIKFIKDSLLEQNAWNHFIIVLGLMMVDEDW